jgi:toxin secretion/phage lysis holin
MQQTFIQIKNSVLSFLVELKPDVTQQYLMSIGAAVGLSLSIALGGIDKMIWALVTLAAIDYLTGMIAAFKTGNWDSNVGFRGIGKKVIIFAFVALANGVDCTLGDGHTFRQIIISAYGVNEAGSILENIDKLGYGNIIPTSIRNGLSRLKEQSDAGKKVNL